MSSTGTGKEKKKAEAPASVGHLQLNKKAVPQVSKPQEVSGGSPAKNEEQKGTNTKNRVTACGGKKMKTKPVSGTHEWSDYSANIQNGCENDCAYCYAKAMAIRFKRATAEGWKVPQIRSADVEKKYNRRNGIIMFPTSHDITPVNINECVTVLKKMLAAGNRVLIVSKPVPECIERLCRELVEYKKQILFRFTISSANNKVLQYWEPGAPSFKARLKSLAIAKNHGFQTSVSSEPMMDNKIEAVVETVLPLITNAVWIGLPNRLQTIVSLNGGDAEMKARARALVDGFTKERIMELYETYKDNPKVKWKESIKKVIGITVPTKPGLDI